MELASLRSLMEEGSLKFVSHTESRNKYDQIVMENSFFKYKFVCVN